MPRPERAFRTEAIVLRRHDFGESDRLLTLLTPDHGKLRGIAKGVRKPAGRMTGHVELFSCTAMMVNYGHDLFVISQAEQIDAHLPLHESMERGAYAYYVVELLDRFSEFEESNASLYFLLRETLNYLSEPTVDLALVARYFEMHLLELVGFRPSLFKCAVGQEVLKAQDQYFSVMDGGVVCPVHVRGRIVTPLSLNGLKMLRYMQTQDFDVVRKVRVGDALHDELERILQSYIVHLLEIRLKSAEFLRLIKREVLKAGRSPQPDAADRADEE